MNSNLKAKAERDALDFSKVRELKRNRNNNLTLQGKLVEVFPVSEPEFVSSKGYATSYFKGEEDVRRGMYVEIEKRCSALNADCYEVGGKLVTWSSDPGFGSKKENYVVQFYKCRLQTLTESERENIQWWQRRMDKDSRWMSEQNRK